MLPDPPRRLSQQAARVLWGRRFESEDDTPGGIGGEFVYELIPRFPVAQDSLVEVRGCPIDKRGKC